MISEEMGSEKVIDGEEKMMERKRQKQWISEKIIRKKVIGGGESVKW